MLGSTADKMQASCTKIQMFMLSAFAITCFDSSVLKGLSGSDWLSPLSIKSAHTLLKANSAIMQRTIQDTTNAFSFGIGFCHSFYSYAALLFSIVSCYALPAAGC